VIIMQIRESIRHKFLLNILANTDTICINISSHREVHLRGKNALKVYIMSNFMEKINAQLNFIQSISRRTNL